MGLCYGDFAIMYRNNSQSLQLKRVLHLHDVPFRIANTIDFDQRREVRDIMALMHLAHHSDFEDYFKRLAEFKALGISKSGMRKFLEWLASDELSLIEALDKVETGASPLNRRQKKALAGVTEVLKSWRRTASKSDLASLFDQIMDQVEYQQHLERTCKEDWELPERRSSIIRLRNLAMAAVSNMSEPFKGFVNLVALEKGESEEDPDKVVLTTLHSAKGLEFPVVFIVGLNQDILPHVHDKDGPNDVAEERRLFYVGITRAEQKLYLTYARHKGLSDAMLAPSEFLAELPDNLIDLN